LQSASTAPLPTKDRLNFNQQFSFNGSTNQQPFGFEDTSSGYGLSSTVGWTHSFKPRFNNSASIAFSRNISKGTPYFAYKDNVASNLVAILLFTSRHRRSGSNPHRLRPAQPFFHVLSKSCEGVAIA
jgi:hypothetical protein